MVAVQDEANFRLRLCIAGTAASASARAGDSAGGVDYLLRAGALPAEANGAIRPRFYHT